MHPQPLFSFTLFGKELSVYLYGLMIAIGIIACVIVFYLYTKKKGMPTKVQDFAFFVIIISIAVGFLFAKLYQAIYDLIDSGVWDFYGAGITAMGGFIGGAATFLVVYFLAGKFYFKGKDKDLHKREFEKIFLVAPICIVIAHAFGRIGCLTAGCCHGKFLSVDYVFGGVYMRGTIYNAASNSYYSKWGYFVPTQLYESLFLFALFAVLSIMYFKRSYRLTMPAYLIAYGLWRLLIEFIREDYRGAKILGLAPSQWQSIVFILGGIAIIVYYLIRKIPLLSPNEKEEIAINEKREANAKRKINEAAKIEKAEANVKKSVDSVSAKPDVASDGKENNG